MELLISSVMVAILVAALYPVFRGVVQMENTTTDMLAAGRPLADLALPLRLDLENAVAPGGLLAGPLLSEKNEEARARRDRLEIYTTSARISDSSPWGEICKVEYTLEEPETGGRDAGRELIRTVTRNLLASSDSTPTAYLLIDGVESLAFSFFDGETWQDSWDATSADTVMPEAIRVDITFVAAEAGRRQRPPLSWTFEIAAQPVSTPTAASSQGGGGGR